MIEFSLNDVKVSNILMLMRVLNNGSSWY